MLKESTIFAISVVNFVLLCAGLFRVGKRSISSFFIGRRDSLDKTINASKQLLADAKSKYDERKKSYDSLEAEINTMRLNVSDRSQNESQTMVREAKEYAERMRIAAKRGFDDEIRRGKIAIQEKLLESAFQKAELQLRSGVDAKQRRSLVDLGVSQLANIQRVAEKR